MNKATEKFAAAVEEYCGWAESEPKTESDEVKIAIRLLAKLYFRVLALPEHGLGNDIGVNRISDEEWKKMLKRFGALPFNYYSVFFSPAKVAEDEPVTGDLADDLADIYRGLNYMKKAMLPKLFGSGIRAFIHIGGAMPRVLCMHYTPMR